jgi:hypothetical protein
MDAHVVPTPAPTAASPWQILPISEADLEEFTRTQYKAFVGTGNPLHDTLFPPASNPAPADIAKGTARHRAALAAEPDNAVFIKVVDDQTGEMAGGAKWCFYDQDAGRPERVQVDWVEPDEQEFTQRVMDEFHGTITTQAVISGNVLNWLIGRRVSRMKGPHARKYSTCPKTRTAGQAAQQCNAHVSNLRRANLKLTRHC